jgi:predicted nucleic acid-binding Zn ribbon protein
MTNPDKKKALQNYRNGKFEAVELILKKALKRHGIENDIARYRFILHWDEIVGKDVAKRAKPDRVSRGVLFVRVASSVWAQELTFQKDLILKKLNSFFSKDQLLKDVKFYVGQVA